MKRKGLHKISFAITKWLMKERFFPEYPLSDFDRIKHEVKQCDVLLVDGHSRMASTVKRLTTSAWSHAAIYIGRINDIANHEYREKLLAHFNGDADTQLLIEGDLGRGIIISPIQRYHKHHIRICRPNGIIFNDSQAVVNYCIDHLGKDYNVRHIFDLARLLIPWSILPRRWGSCIFKQSQKNENEICSSLIAKAFNKVNFPILPYAKRDSKNRIQLFKRNPMLYVPKDFDTSPYFDIVKYPFFYGSKLPTYKTMPWSKDSHHSK